MPSPDLQYLHTIIDHHPRSSTATSTVKLTLVTPSDRIREVPLDEDDLVRLIAESSKCLAILRGVRT